MPKTLNTKGFPPCVDINKRRVVRGFSQFWTKCVGCGHERFVHAFHICKAINRTGEYTGYCLKCAPRIAGVAKRGAKNSNWKGGLNLTVYGYIMVTLPYGHPLACMASSSRRYALQVLQHRLVMAECLGRPLTKDEIVHHKNGIRDDNRIENLELTTRSEHPLELAKAICPHCGKRFGDAVVPRFELACS